jgi:hypothetical protein
MVLIVLARGHKFFKVNFRVRRLYALSTIIC